jgi:hypothetical protein
MTRKCLLQALPVAWLGICISIQIGCAAEQKSPQASPLSPIAFLVGGTWTAKLPKGPPGAPSSIETHFDWGANHQNIRFDSYFVSGEKRFPYTSGMYGWNPGKRKIVFWYSDSEGSLHEGAVTKEGLVLVQDFTITDKDGKVTNARSRLTQPGPDAFNNEILVAKEGGEWQRIVEVKYERPASGPGAKEGDTSAAHK